MGESKYIRWAAASQAGPGRLANEDSWLAFTAGVRGASVLPELGEIRLDHEDIVFAVSDGMGGGNAGELASSLIMEKLSEIIPATFRAAASGLYPDSLAYLKDVLRQVHDEINLVGECSEKHQGMGATLAMIWFAPENLYFANIGDSRIYRCRDCLTEQISKDHTSAWDAWKRGEIQEAEYRAHPRRSALYQAMGGGQSNIFPHLGVIPYEKGDRFLICSDGLVDGIWEKTIANLLKEKAKPQKVRDQLIARAVGNLVTDDISAILIDVGS